MTEEQKATFDEWAVVELMGHRKLAGKVTEATIAGHGLIRLDVPDGPTQFYNPSSIYCLTPVSEDTARAFAKAHVPAPVTRWELPQLPARPKACRVRSWRRIDVCISCDVNGPPSRPMGAPPPEKVPATR